MARRNLNPLVRHLAVFERKNANTIAAHGCFMDRARGETLNTINIPVNTVTKTLTDKIASDNMYLGVVQYTTNLQEYVISTIYDNNPNQMCYVVCKNISKDYEAAEVISGLHDFYKKNGLTFDSASAMDWANVVIENESTLVIGHPIKFEYIKKIVPYLNIPASNYYFEILTGEQAEQLAHELVYMDDTHEDWNKAFAPVPIEKIEYGTYVMPENLSVVVTTVIPKILEKRGNVTIGFVGDSGNGKTVACEHIANYLTQKFGRKISFTKVSVPLIARASDFFLERDFKDGSTVNEYTPFFNLLTKGDAVILLDETNRVPSDILNVILGITDGSNTFTLRGQTHAIGKNITFILAYNVGYEYTGTFDIDKALVSRMKVRVDFGLPSREELMRIATASYPEAPINVIEGMINLCHELSKQKKANKVSVDVSIRALLNWLSVYEPFDWKQNMLLESLKLSMINFASDDDEKAHLISVIKTVFNGVA